MNDRYDPRIRHRRSIRLKGYDYSLGGAYFVTITARGRACLFGEVAGEQMRLNEAGGMVQEVCWGLSQQFPRVEVGCFVVMPNHVRGIIVLYEPVGAALVVAQSEDNRAAGNNRATTRVAPTLGGVVGAFKSLTTVEYVRGVRGQGWTPFRGRLWQRNYYEHIVRDDKSLGRIEQYILDNPANWSLDQENPLYVPEDITEPWDRPIEVWNQFCTEARSHHKGRMCGPVVQEEFGYELR